MNRRFLKFFEADKGGAAGSAGGAPQNQGNANVGNEGQQQQQNQQSQPIDPFKDIDLDLLDDVTKANVIKARESLQSLQTQNAQLTREAETGRKWQSEFDKLKVQMQQPNGNGNGNGHQQQQQPPTLEQELVQTYIDNGLQPADAAKAAKIQAKILESHGNRLRQQIGSELIPLANTTASIQANNAFIAAQQNDKVGAFQIPEISQKVWEKAQEMANAGQVVTSEILSNLKNIFYVNHLEAGGQPMNSQLQFQPQPVLQPLQSQTTRFSYPGAGSVPRMPISKVADSMDAETSAAVAAATQGWPKKKS